MYCIKPCKWGYLTTNLNWWVDPEFQTSQSKDSSNLKYMSNGLVKEGTWLQGGDVCIFSVKPNENFEVEGGCLVGCLCVFLLLLLLLLLFSVGFCCYCFCCWTLGAWIPNMKMTVKTRNLKTPYLVRCVVWYRISVGILQMSYLEVQDT